MKKEYYIIYSDIKNSVLSIKGIIEYDDIELAKKVLIDYENSQRGFKGDYRIETKFKIINENKIKETKENKSFGDF